MQDFTPISQGELENFIQEDSQLEKLIGLANKPIALFKELVREGFSSLKRNLVYVLLFGFLQFWIILYATYRLVQIDFTGTKFLFWVLVVLVGIAGIAILIFRMYKLILLDYYIYLFRKFRPFVQKLTDYLVELTEKNTPESIDVQAVKAYLDQSLNHIPSLIRKAVLFVFQFIPITNLLTEVYQNSDELITSEDKSSFLLNRIYEKVTEFVTDQNSPKWALILLGICGIIQFYLLFFQLI